MDETRAISEDFYAALEKHGNLVSTTIEHAARVAQLPSIHVEEIGTSTV